MSLILNESQVHESWKEFTNQEEIRSNNYLDVSLEKEDKIWYTKKS